VEIAEKVFKVRG